MWMCIIILLCSIWMLACFFITFYGGSIISLFGGFGYLGLALKSVVLNWGLLFGLFGIPLSIVGLIMKSNKSQEFDQMIYAMTWFYAILSAILLI